MAINYVFPPQSITVSPPSGGATLAEQQAQTALLTTIDADTSSLVNQLPATLGQKTKANSLAVVLASDSDTLPVSGPLTDAQLRASAVPVSGPLTDAELRASAVPVSASSLPLPTGAATETTLSSIDTKTPALVGGRVPVDGSGVTQPISAASLPLPTGAATEATLATLATEATLSAINTKLPASLGEKAEANSLAVTLSTENEAILSSIDSRLTDIELNTNPKIINSMSQSTTTTSATLTAPAGSKGFTIQNSTRASGAVRFTKTGGGASASVGFLLEPGQSTSYQDGASSLDIFAVDGTAVDVTVIWYV